MTFAQTIQALNKEVEKNCTEEQKQIFKSFGIAKIHEIVQFAQSMGIKSTISCYL